MIRDTFRLIRGTNLIFLAILLWMMDRCVAVPVMQNILFDAVLPSWLLAMIITATVLIAAGGYVINDYFDVKIDRINRPDELIITRSWDKQHAFRLSLILNGIGMLLGLAVAFICRSWTLGIIYIMTPGVLWFYSSGYKRQLLLGNIVIGLVSGLTPMLIAFANIGYAHVRFDRMGDIISQTPLAHELYIWLGGFGLFAMLTTLIREIIKDMQDMEGDAEMECHSLPVVLGEQWTKVIVSVLALVTMGLMVYCNYALLPFDTAFRSPNTRFLYFGLLTPMVGMLVLLWSAKIPSDYKAVQLTMKFVMFMGTMFGFVILKLL